MRSSVTTLVCKTLPTIVVKPALLRAWLLRPFAALRARVRHHPVRARTAYPPRLSDHKVAPHELTQMRAALSDVLEHHPRARLVMPSLAVIERALARSGRALERVPLPWVRDASLRLDTLVGDWSSDGLKQLRDHLRGLCKTSEAADPELSALSDSSEVEVSETSLSRFIEADEMLIRQLEAHRQRAARAC